MKNIKKMDKAAIPGSLSQLPVKQQVFIRKKTFENLKKHLGTGFSRFFNN